MWLVLMELMSGGGTMLRLLLLAVLMIVGAHGAEVMLINT